MEHLKLLENGNPVTSGTTAVARTSNGTKAQYFTGIGSEYDIGEFGFASQHVVHFYERIDRADTCDIPDEMLDRLIECLELLIISFIERSHDHDSLQIAGKMLSGDDLEYTQHRMLNDIRRNIVRYLLCSALNDPFEAFPHLCDLVNDHQIWLRRRKSTYAEIPWLDNMCTPRPVSLPDPHTDGHRELYRCYADVRVRVGEFDNETKDLLEHLSEVPEYSTLYNDRELIAAAVLARMNLALVLHEMDIEHDKQKMYLEWCKNHLRKQIHLKENIARYFQDHGHSDHPFYSVLGDKWFEERSLTAREEMWIDMLCACCKQDTLLKTLSRCKGCKCVYYCSKACQKAHWPLHREFCRHRANTRKAIRWLKEFDPRAARAQSELLDWIKGMHYADTDATSFLLGLHHDPSRSRQLIIFRRLVHVPPEERQGRKDVRSYFHVVQCGVFKLQDVYQDIETLSGIDPGDAKAKIESMLEPLGSDLGDAGWFPMLQCDVGP